MGKQTDEQERLRDLQGSQGSGGSYGTGGGFEGEGPSAPARRRTGHPAAEAGQSRAEVQGDFGDGEGPDGEPIEHPPTRPSQGGRG